MLVDYEVYFNQAFKNLKYVKLKDPENIFADRGIAEIAYILYLPYLKLQHHDIAERLIYNALIKYEPPALKSGNFTILYALAQLEMKMAQILITSFNVPQKAYDNMTKCITAFKNAESNAMNYTHVLLYSFYVDFAEAWLTMYKVVNLLPKEQPKPYTSLQCLQNAMKNIDIALNYNSVYGIDAVSIRNEVLLSNADLKKKFEESF